MPTTNDDEESPPITLRDDILPESVPFVDQHDNGDDSSESTSSTSSSSSINVKNISKTSAAPKIKGENDSGGGGGGKRSTFSDAFPWVSSPQAIKIRKFAKMFQLNTVFGQLGRCIAITPTAFFISAIIIGFTTVGMYRMHLRDRVRDGYTPTTSPSRYETDVLRNFFGLKSDPTVTLVILYAKDGGSMHRPEHLAETLRVHNHIRKHVNVSFDGNIFAFNDFCGAFCETGYFFQYFAESLIEVASGKSSELFRPWSRLDFPISKVHGIDFHFERNLFGVKTAPQIDHATTDYNRNRKDMDAIHNITNIRYIEVVQLMYHGETIKGLDEEKLAEWELQLYKYAREEFWSNLINMEVLGSEIVDHEMNKDSQMMGPYVGLGVALMLGFACFAMIAGSYYFGFLTFEVLALAFVSTFGSLLSVGTTLGIYGFTQMRVNSVLLVMPFLTLGIGVNDSFMLAHAHFRHQSTSPNVKIHMQRILSEVGPSITITSLTNVVTFLIGSWTPTAEIKLFCIGAAIALGYSYVFTLIFFCPTLVYVYNANQKLKNSCIVANNGGGEEREPALRRFMKRVMTAISTTYTYLVCCKYFQLLNVCIYLTYLLFGIYGTINISAKLDTEKILPAKSVIRKPHEIVAHKIWVEYYPMQLFITEPFDLANEQQMSEFNVMMNEFYALPQSKGRKYTISWFDDYKKYFDESNDDFNFDFHSETGVSEDLGPVPKTGYDLRYMKSFLTNPVYEHYHTTLRLNNETNNWKKMKIEKFTLTIVFAGIDDWQGRIDIMVKWRQIAKRYPNLGAVVWETNAMFVDQMLTMKTFSLQSAALTLACMFVVCAIFIQTPLGVGVAVISIGSISFGVVGYLYFWGLDLDPASLCAILMSVGMSVDFTAHTIYSYLNREKEIYQNGEKIVIRVETEFERVANCIHQVMYPMTLGGISTVLCVLPLMIFSDYVPLVFFKTVILVVIFGFYHGVVVLPVVLVLLTPPVERLSKAMKKRFFKRQNIAIVDATADDIDSSLPPLTQKSVEMESI